MIELRQSPVVFDEAAHRYWLGEKELKGITSTLVNRVFPFEKDYGDVDKETLKRAADRGHAVHAAIQRFEDEGEFSAIPELEEYATIKEREGLQHVASEYIVSDEKTYASAIDLVMVDRMGEIVLADIKTTYSRHYDKTALQLSIYRRFFEMQNPGLKVSRIAMIWLRGEQSEFRELHPLAEEALDDVFRAEAEDTQFDITSTYGDLPAVFAQVEDEVARLEEQAAQVKARQEELRKGLYALMEKADVKKFTGSRVTLTRVLPTEATTFDSKALKAEHPEIWAKYVKKTQKAGSLRVTLKK